MRSIQLDWTQTTPEEQIEKMLCKLDHVYKGLDILMLDKARRDLGEDFPKELNYGTEEETL